MVVRARWAIVGSLLVAFGCAEGSDTQPQGGQSSTASSGGSGEGGMPALGGGGASTDGGGGSAAGGAPTGGGGAGGAPSTCGDAVLDDGEACDTTPTMSCVDLGYSAGVLACADDCSFDPSMCTSCHDGVIQPELGEDCDFDSQGDPLVLASCASLGFPQSATNPGCNDMCEYDIKICLCGDETLDVLEVCDGDLLDGQTCQTQGFTAGTLQCSLDCELDTSGCTGCGNGMVEAGEQCDDSNMVSGDGCSATCQTEAVSCDPDGNYLIQGSPVAYSCCMGLVSVNVSQFIFSQNGAAISSSPSNPATMIGSQTTCPSGSFTNQASLPGGCTETYTLDGSFSNNDTWSGTYSVQFTGSDCSCFGGMFGTPCVSQVYPITAVR